MNSSPGSTKAKYGWTTSSPTGCHSSEAPHGYKIFCDKADDCVKVVLTP